MFLAIWTPGYFFTKKTAFFAKTGVPKHQSLKPWRFEQKAPGGAFKNGDKGLRSSGENGFGQDGQDI